MKKLVVLLLVLSMVMAMTACSSDEEPSNVTPTGTTDVTTTETPTGEETQPTVDVPTITWTTPDDVNAESTNVSKTGWNLYMFPLSIIQSGDQSDPEVQKIIKYSNFTDYVVNLFIGWKVDESNNHMYAYTAKDMTSDDPEKQVVIYVTETQFNEVSMQVAPYSDLDVLTGVELKEPTPEPTQLPAAIQAMEVVERESKKNSDTETTEEITTTEEPSSEETTDETTTETVEETTKETTKKSKKKNK